MNLNAQKCNEQTAAQVRHPSPRSSHRPHRLPARRRSEVCLMHGGSDEVPVQQLNPRVPDVACNS